MTWLVPTESRYINSLYYLGMYEELIVALENQIEFGKKVVDYFEGFYGSQEIKVYKLAIYLNKPEKELQMEKRFKEVYQMSPEEISKMKQEALNKYFEFAELSSW